MTNYIQNYGFTKTYIMKNNKKIKNKVKWIGDYDGNKANIEIYINDNGNRELVRMQLNNNDIMNLLEIQPISIPLDQRLTNDFLDKNNKPIVLEGALTNKKTRKYTRRNITHKQKTKRKTYKHY